MDGVNFTEASPPPNLHLEGEELDKLALMGESRNQDSTNPDNQLRSPCFAMCANTQNKAIADVSLRRANVAHTCGHKKKFAHAHVH